MRGKRFLIAVGSASLVFAALNGCGDKSTSPSKVIPAEAVGVWVGDTTIDKGQVGTPPDSFRMSLSLESSGAFRLDRSKVVHASATSMPDTAIEIGTCTVNGTALTLTPKTCSTYVFATGTVDPCDCAPQFTAHTIQNTIANNQWKISIMDWTNPDTITYTAKKQ